MKHPIARMRLMRMYGAAARAIARYRWFEYDGGRDLLENFNEFHAGPYKSARNKSARKDGE